MENEQIVMKLMEAYGYFFTDPKVGDSFATTLLNHLEQKDSQFHAELEAMGREVEGKNMGHDTGDGYSDGFNTALTTIQSDIINPRIKKYS